MIDWLQRFLCRHFHDRISRPMHGRYICWTCGLETPVNWDVHDHRISSLPGDRAKLAQLQQAVSSNPTDLESQIRHSGIGNVVPMPRRRASSSSSSNRSA